jgi:NADPH:quinone reductase-like Zn-dependent oxidoreductase
MPRFRTVGATVATTVSAGNVDFARELGADNVIDYRNQDFEQHLHGYDLVLDSVGGENLEKSLRVLRPVVGRVFSFDQTVEAMQSIGKGGIRGKAVISRSDTSRASRR